MNPSRERTRSMYYKIFKLIIIGDGGVGKTTLVNRYATGKFTINTQMTLGIQYETRQVHIGEDLIDLQIWDFGGQEQYRVLLPTYCKGANGALILHDLTRPDTLYHLLDWISIIRHNINHYIPILIIGTKIDLPHSNKLLDEAKQFTREQNVAGYAEISSKTGENIEQVFQQITELMLKNMPVFSRDKGE